MQRFKLLSLCNIYILLWIVYYLQSTLFSGIGSRIPALLGLLLIGISAYHVIYAWVTYKMPSYMKALSVLLIMFTVYGIALILSDKNITPLGADVISKSSYIKNIYISLLPIFSFFVFTKNGQLTRNKILVCTFLFFAAAVAQFYQFQRSALMRMTTVDAEEITNNTSYIFLSLLPLLAFWDHKRIIQYLGFALSIAFVILGMKRGAMLIGVLAVVWFLYHSMRSASRKQRFWVILFSVVVIILGYRLVTDMLETSSYFNFRLQETLEGNSSGRNEIYDTLWHHFIQESSLLRFLFGNGANATLILASNYAHNDWLEIATNQGVFGLIVYFTYWVLLYKMWRKSKFDNQIYLALGTLCLIFFLKSFVSMSYSGMNIYSTMCLGYCVGVISESESAHKSVRDEK